MSYRLIDVCVLKKVHWGKTKGGGGTKNKIERQAHDYKQFIMKSTRFIFWLKQGANGCEGKSLMFPRLDRAEDFLLLHEQLSFSDTQLVLVILRWVEISLIKGKDYWEALPCLKKTAEVCMPPPPPSKKKREKEWMDGCMWILELFIIYHISVYQPISSVRYCTDTDKREKNEELEEEDFLYFWRLQLCFWVDQPFLHISATFI